MSFYYSIFFINLPSLLFFFFFFNDTATTEIYTLSLHDALPISRRTLAPPPPARGTGPTPRATVRRPWRNRSRSEEHTSELQSPCNLVCRLLLEKKKKKTYITIFDAQDNELLIVSWCMNAVY